VGGECSVSQSCELLLSSTLALSDDLDNQVLYAFSIVLFWGDLKQVDGLDTGHWFWGTTLYLAVLLTVLGKAALISEYVVFVVCSIYQPNNLDPCSLWTKYTVAGKCI